MITFGGLADEVLINLQGDSLDQNEQTFLIDSLDSSTLEFMVDDPRQISTGLIEIDSELMWVKQVDLVTGLVTASPFGRGFRGTVAVDHSAGSAVSNSPRWSRHRVKQQLNNAIEMVYPDIFALATIEVSYVAARLAYQLPADCEGIHSVSWDVIGPSRVWWNHQQYEFIPNANTDAFPTGKAIQLWDTTIPGRTVHVVYRKSPVNLENESDVFSTVTGLADSAKEAIIYGACYRLVGYTEASRVQNTSVEANNRSEMVPPGTASNAGKWFYSLFQEALSQERERLLRNSPSRVVRTRRLM